LFGFSDSSAIAFEHITQIAFPNMSETPNLHKKDPSTDRFCFSYDCFFGLQLGPSWIELSSVQNNSSTVCAQVTKISTQWCYLMEIDFAIQH